MKLNKTQYFIRPSLCLATLFFLCTSTVSALSSDKESSPENFCHTSDIKNKFITQNDSFNVQATKDLDAIFEQGILRVLLQKKNDDCIVSKTEKLLIEEFANTYGLKINWFYVNNERSSHIALPPHVNLWALGQKSTKSRQGPRALRS